MPLTIHIVVISLGAVSGVCLVIKETNVHHCIVNKVTLCLGQSFRDECNIVTFAYTFIQKYGTVEKSDEQVFQYNKVKQ